MNVETLSRKIGEYARTVLAQKASAWPSKFALGAASVVAEQRAPALVASAGAVRPDGEVDLEVLRAVVKAGFDAAGHVDLLGGMLGFDPSDADDFFSWLGA